LHGKGNKQSTNKSDKPTKESFTIFHNITQAFVKGNPKPKKGIKRTKPDDNKISAHQAGKRGG
jgi:hypothetical protein